MAAVCLLVFGLVLIVDHALHPRNDVVPVPSPSPVYVYLPASSPTPTEKSQAPNPKRSPTAEVDPLTEIAGPKPRLRSTVNPLAEAIDAVKKSRHRPTEDSNRSNGPDPLSQNVLPTQRAKPTPDPYPFLVPLKKRRP